jgi:hypothetical protein
MPIDSICSGCGKTLRVDDEFAGRKARCPVCGSIYSVVSPAQDSDALRTKSTNLQLEKKPDPFAPTWNDLPTQELIHPSTPSIQPTQTIQGGVASSLAPSGDRFFVRPPDGTVYGPVDQVAVMRWLQEGRLNNESHIKRENETQWLGIPAWLFQIKQNANPIVERSRVDSGLSKNPFGSAPVSANQSAGYAQPGNGIWILILGIFSWILCPTLFGSFACSTIAIIMAKNEIANIRSGRTPESQRMMALTGMWLSIINICCALGAIVFVIIISIISP